MDLLGTFNESGLTNPFTNVAPSIATTQPATQASQVDRTSQIIGAIVAGTPAIIQSIKAPSGFYTPVKAGTSVGASSGAAQTNTPKTSMWTYVLVAGVGLLGLGVALKYAR